MTGTNSSRTSNIKPTRETYDALQQAYETLNKSLFASELPNCLITFHRRKNSFGYFAAERFGREDGKRTDEIALNPVHFRDRALDDVLSTLVHEMVHLWQHHFGKPGRGRYHNREWAAKMKSVGLQPTSTGGDDGKETGEAMYHTIIEDGAFARTVHKMTVKGFSIPWAEIPTPETPAADDSSEGRNATRKSGKRVKYVCPQGDLNAWAKHGASLICGQHLEEMVPEGGDGAEEQEDEAAA